MSVHYATDGFVTTIDSSGVTAIELVGGTAVLATIYEVTAGADTATPIDEMIIYFSEFLTATGTGTGVTPTPLNNNIGKAAAATAKENMTVEGTYTAGLFGFKIPMHVRATLLYQMIEGGELVTDLVAGDGWGFVASGETYADDVIMGIKHHEW